MPNRAEFSIVVPCYNEELQLPKSIPPLISVLRSRRVRFEMILVVNGSLDRTGEVVDRFKRRGYPIRRVDVPRNLGYGLGVLAGLRRARAPHVCIMWADGQVAPSDVWRVISSIRGTSPGTMIKARRRERKDGLVRILVSKAWNLLFALRFGRISPDVNACPKVLHRSDLKRLELVTHSAFLEAEIMVKARRLGLHIVEVPVRFRKRGAGVSHVRLASYSLDFLRSLLVFTRDRRIRRWLAGHPRA